MRVMDSLVLVDDSSWIEDEKILLLFLSLLEKERSGGPGLQFGSRDCCRMDVERAGWQVVGVEFGILENIVDFAEKNFSKWASIQVFMWEKKREV